MAVPRALPSWLIDHWQLKLFSLVLAILLWVFVATEEQVETVMSLPIEFGQIPRGLEVVGDSDSVDVRIRGLRSILSRLGNRDIRVTVNLREAAAGERTIRLAPELVHAPPGVHVLGVSPSRLRLHLQPLSAARAPAASSGSSTSQGSR